MHHRGNQPQAPRLLWLSHVSFGSYGNRSSTRSAVQVVEQHATIVSLLGPLSVVYSLLIGTPQCGVLTPYWDPSVWCTHSLLGPLSVVYSLLIGTPQCGVLTPYWDPSVWCTHLVLAFPSHSPWQPNPRSSTEECLFQYPGVCGWLPWLSI